MTRDQIAATCQGKDPFRTWRSAMTVAAKNKRVRLVPYRCRVCGAWHVGSEGK